MNKFGTLYLAPAPLDFGCDPPLPAITDVLPLGTLQHMARIQYWICENAKTQRALLKRVDEVVPLSHPIQECHIAVLPRSAHKKGDHVPGQVNAQEALALLQPALQGHDIALASEAGLPAIADPGSSIVRAAHAAGIQVIPLTGPCSLLLALAASGLNGQNFAFVGYLPQDTGERTLRLRQLEQLTHKIQQSQIWIETPYRNLQVLEHACQTLQSQTRLSIACGLTLQNMQVHSMTIAQWRKNPVTLPAKMPAVFTIGV